MTDEDKGQTNQMSFMQKRKNVMCYKCGKKVTMQTSVPVRTMTLMMVTCQRDQLDQTGATTEGQTALDGVAYMMVFSHCSKREA